MRLAILGLTIALGVLSVPPLKAQEAAKIPRIGVLASASTSARVPTLQGLWDGLRGLGYVEAVQELAQVDWKTARPILARLLAEDPSAEVCLAAVRAAASFPEPAVAGLLVKSWKNYPPALAREAIEALVSKWFDKYLQDRSAGRGLTPRRGSERLTTSFTAPRGGPLGNALR